MLVKLKKALPIIIFAIVTVAIGSVLFEKCGSNAEHKAFLAQVDSLHKVNDSLQAEIAKDDAAIDSLDIVAVELQYKVDHQKAKVIKIKEIVEIEVDRVKNLKGEELVSHFNQRYPADTVSNLLPIAQPVLSSASQDLAKFDGLKQEVVLKDSSIATLEEKVTVKDRVGKIYYTEVNERWGYKYLGGTFSDITFIVWYHQRRFFQCCRVCRLV